MCTVVLLFIFPFLNDKINEVFLWKVFCFPLKTILIPRFNKWQTNVKNHSIKSKVAVVVHTRNHGTLRDWGRRTASWSQVGQGRKSDFWKTGLRHAIQCEEKGKAEKRGRRHEGRREDDRKERRKAIRFWYNSQEIIAKFEIIINYLSLPVLCPNRLNTELSLYPARAWGGTGGAPRASSTINKCYIFIPCHFKNAFYTVGLAKLPGLALNLQHCLGLLSTSRD